MVIEIINTGIGYIQQGLEVVRTFLMKITGYLPWDANLSVMILFLAVSFLAGNFIVKRFVTRPFEFTYLPYTLLIIISIFLNLMYF